VRVWRGVDPEGTTECVAAGAPARLIVWATDYGGGHKAWVRRPDGRDEILAGSKVERHPPLGALAREAVEVAARLEGAAVEKAHGLRGAARADLFSKFRKALTGPFDPIVLPRISEHIDFESKLAVDGLHQQELVGLAAQQSDRGACAPSSRSIAGSTSTRRPTSSSSASAPTAPTSPAMSPP
jgi:hypothetical protein